MAKLETGFSLRSYGYRKNRHTSIFSERVFVPKTLAEGSRSGAMVFTPRCYWPRRTDDSYQNTVVAGTNGLEPGGHSATYNNPQLLRPHRQVFPTHLPGPRSSAAHRRIQVKCNTNARESCAARENYWLSQQRKLLFPPAAKLIHFAKQYLFLHT